MRAGRTTGSVNLPHLDVPLAAGRARVVNIHRNEPGVLSAINTVVAGSGTNIVGQQLATLADVGLLFVDLEMSPTDPRAHQLAAAIGALEPSLRTRLVGG
jgi:D-3-phosphoglycerate dehydrogenase